MVLPIIAAIAVAAGGAAIGVATGYAIDKHLGDDNYTRRELATDAVVGMIPGLGLLRPSAKIAASSRKLRYFDRAQGDRLRDIPVAMAYHNRSEITTIAKTIGTEKAVSLIAGQLLAESGRSSSSSFQQNGGRPGTSSKSAMRKVTWNRSSKGGKWTPSCPSGFKLQRVGKKLMCVPT